MKRKRDPNLPINVYRTEGTKYFHYYARINGKYEYKSGFLNPKDAADAANSLPRRFFNYISVSWRSDNLKWRVRIGKERKDVGNFTTWDDAWAAVNEQRLGCKSTAIYSNN